MKLKENKKLLHFVKQLLKSLSMDNVEETSDLFFNSLTGIIFLNIFEILSYVVFCSNVISNIE